MTKDKETLEQLVVEYVETLSRIKELAMQLKQCKEPEKPTGIVSLEKLEQYKAECAQIAAFKLTIQDQSASNNNQLKPLPEMIIKIIGVKGVWVEAGQYAVGFYWDIWGGGHFDLAVAPKTGELPSLLDRTYYP